jgi:hypothetical protein
MVVYLENYYECADTLTLPAEMTRSPCFQTIVLSPRFSTLHSNSTVEPWNIRPEKIIPQESTGILDQRRLIRGNAGTLDQRR